MLLSIPAYVYILALPMQGAPRGRSGTVDTPEGNGTGFVWDSEGHVVTNFHVLASALKGLRPNQLQGEGSPKVAKLTLFSRSCLSAFHPQSFKLTGRVKAQLWPRKGQAHHVNQSLPECIPP